MPARSALGAVAGVNPAAVIKASIWAALALPGLHDKGSARGQKAGRLGNQRAVGVQPVGAAIECGQRIVIPDLRRQAVDIRRADIGRIRDDQIERAG